MTSTIDQDYKITQFGRIPLDWKIGKIGDITTTVTDYVANGSFASLAENVEYKENPDYATLIRLADYHNDFKGKFVYIDEHAYNYLSKSKLFGGEIIISNVGDVGTVFKCPFLKTKMSLAPNSIMVKFSEYDDFYYYWLKSKFGQFMLSTLISGSAQPKFNKTSFKNMEAPIPPLPEQKAIAEVLSSFDDKIELLRAENQTLEEMGQTLFKEWFGKYKLGNELPDGWRVGKLGEIVDHIKINIIPSKKPDEVYSHYSLPAFDEGQKPSKEKGETIMSNKYKVIENSILISKLNPFFPRIRTIFEPENNGVCSTEFQVLKPKTNTLFSFCHCILNSQKFTDDISKKVQGTSSSHQRVKPDDILNSEIIIGDEQSISDFHEVFYPMLKQIENNKKQIEKLSETRDQLLPKLMSGEVRVEF